MTNPESKSFEITQPPSVRASTTLFRLASDYGMLLVLFVLCAFFCIVTYSEQHPTGVAAANQLAERIVSEFGTTSRVLVVGG